MDDADEPPLSRREQRRADLRAKRDAARARKEAARAEGGFPSGFVLVLVFGGALLCVPPGDNLALAVAQWFVPILLTALYAIVGWNSRVRTGSPRDLIFIDNCYYIGFLFTQLALVISFLRLWLFREAAHPGERTAFTSEELVPLIAASLGASVVGLTAKVILDQIVKDPTAITQQAHADLQVSASSMVIQLKSVEGLFGELSETLKESLIGAKSTIDTIRLTEHAVSERSSDIASAVDELASAVRALHSRFDQMASMTQTDLKGMTNEFNEAVRKLEAVAQLANSSVDIMQQSKRGVEAITRAGETVARGVSDKLEKTVAANVTRAADRLADELKQRLDLLRGVVEDFEKQLREVERQAGLTS